MGRDTNPSSPQESVSCSGCGLEALLPSLYNLLFINGSNVKPLASLTSLHYTFFMTDERPCDLITVTEARTLLGVSAVKMARLLKEGTLRHWPNILDNRVKLVSRAEVLALKELRRRV